MIISLVGLGQMASSIFRNGFSVSLLTWLAYGKRYGLINSGNDINGIISYLQDFIRYCFFVSPVPWLVVFCPVTNLRWKVAILVVDSHIRM